MGNNIVVGLSGGVDSAVCAGLLTRAGWTVTGVYLDIGLGGQESARAVADRLGIDFVALDIRDALEKQVIAPFVNDYLSARTPNPCIRCNPTVKFPALLDTARRLGADHVATGHYARIVEGDLLRGHPNRDQSYMLYRLTDDQRAHIVFPLGDHDKTQVRAMARDWGLAVADAPDSMEICFVPDGDLPRFLASKATPPPPGDFVGPDGALLGRHKGLHHYTVGQRRGLGLALPAPLYVSALRPETNEVVLSPDSDVYLSEITVGDCVWHRAWGRAECRTVSVRVRHSKTAWGGVVTRTESGANVVFSKAARAPAPGQSAVFYDGETVLGGGIIL